MTTQDRAAGPRLRIRQTVLDSADHRQHAEFYRRLLGAEYRPGSEPGETEEPQYIEVHEPASGFGLAFQVSEGYVAPDWPDHERAQTQAHVDIDVPTPYFDHAVKRAVSLGGRILSTEQRDEGLVVLEDPAGHPFCFLEVGGAADVPTE